MYAYGDAASLPAISPAHPIVGIVAAPGGGYWLYTAYGNVYNSHGTAWYGSPFVSRVGSSSIAGMAGTQDGKGYWLVNSAGDVYAYADAVSLPSLAHAQTIRGVVTEP